jgi:hypothetical protein
VELTDDVDNIMFAPFVVHTARLMLCVPAARFVPVIVRLRSGLPAIALVGEIELITTAWADGAGEGLGAGGSFTVELLPHPDAVITAAARSRIMISRSM